LENIIKEELKYLSTRNEDKWCGSMYEVVKKSRHDSQRRFWRESHRKNA
jgi:hypothetical protein